jgi:hypothetical protein
VKPEWNPPATMTDPFVRRLSLSRADWGRAMRGRILEMREVAVAHTVAGYANRDGTNAHPGVARLVEDLISSDKTIRRSLAALVEGGWLTVSHRGRRKLKEADVYHLTVPAPVAVELGRWSEAHGEQWMERPIGEPKRPDAAANSDRKKRPFPQVTSDRRKTVAPVTDELLAVTSGVPPVTGDLPPGLSHQGLSHQSEIRSRPRATARSGQTDRVISRIVAGIDPDGEGVAEELRDAIEAEGFYVLEDQQFDGMLSDGQPLPRVVAVAIAGQRPSVARAQR